jgi:hypothetical protein
MNIPAPPAPVMAPQAPIQQAPAPGVTFSLTPAKHNNGVLDYGSTEGRKLYVTATAALPIKVDVSPHQTLMLLTEMSHKSYDNGWGDLWRIPVKFDATGAVVQTHDLLTEHGMVTIKQVQDFAATYADTHSRMAQNGLACYTCLSLSLSTEGRTKLLADLAQVKVTAQAIANGPLLLKLILDRSTTTTRSTLTLLFQRINSLDILIEKGSNDVEKFNEQVKIIVMQIQERGAKVEDENLMVNLFRAYLSVSDSVFRRYVENQRDDYNDGVKDLSPNKLMELAGNKYKSLVEEDMWQAPTASDKEIVALRAQIAELKKSPSPAPQKDKFEKKKKFDKKKDSEKFAWKSVPPKSGEPVKKKVGGKTYHWCVKHASWTLHTPEQCHKAETTTDSPPPTSQQLLLQTALMSIMDDGQEEEDDNEE